MDNEQAKDTDKLLVARVQKGDKRAFDLLVMKYQYKVHAIVSRYVKDFDEVNDVVQEAFIKAYRALAKFRGESAFYTWLYRIAVIQQRTIWLHEPGAPPPVMSMLKRPLFMRVARNSVILTHLKIFSTGMNSRPWWIWL